MPVSYESLRSVPLLQDLDDKELRRLAGNLRERRVAAGEKIVHQGPGAMFFFVILEGDAAVETDGVVRTTLGPGDPVGELALLDEDGPRTATVRATSDVTLAALASWEFKPFLLEHPTVGWRLLRFLARRLREAQLAGTRAPA